MSLPWNSLKWVLTPSWDLIEIICKIGNAMKKIDVKLLQKAFSYSKNQYTKYLKIIVNNVKYNGYVQI
jgi:hypothetical protein